jgi:hypothetical protein
LDRVNGGSGGVTELGDTDSGVAELGDMAG